MILSPLIVLYNTEGYSIHITHLLTKILERGKTVFIDECGKCTKFFRGKFTFLVQLAGKSCRELATMYAVLA